jgi:DNA-binding beta-propeller fold protein YncE
MITRRSFSVMLASTLAHSTVLEPRFERTIPLPGIQGRIDHFSVDAKGGRLFMAALGNGSVEVIDCNLQRVVHSIAGLKEPQGLLYLPQENRLYVATGGDGSLRIYNGTTFRLVSTARLGSDADNVRFDSVANAVYVGYGEGAIAVVDVNGTVQANIALTAHPESFQMERNGSRLYVNVPDSKRVVVIDREKRSVIAEWNIAEASANFPMALDEERKRLFVVCRRPARMLVFDTNSGKIVQTLSTVGDADDIFFNTARRELYVSGGEGAVDVLGEDSANGYKQRARIVTSAGARTSLFVPDWSRLFIAVPRRSSDQPAHLLVYAVV